MSTCIEPVQETNRSAISNAVSATHPAKKNTANNRFQNLWDEAERAREANLVLEESLEALVTQVRSELAPHERKLGFATRRQLFKLITFSSRTSLLQWQRAALDEWVAESMNTLHQLGLVDGELIDHLARAEARVLNIDIDEDSDVLAVDQLTAAIEEQSMKSPDSDRNEFEEGEGADHSENDEEFDFKTWYDEQVLEANLKHDVDRDSQARADKRKLQDSKTFFRTLFCRAARALHPDKVTDLKEKQARQSLMAQLLEARRNRDLMSVYKLYREYVDSDANFAEQNLAELEVVLNRFIELQSERRFDLITQSPTHKLSYKLFYAKSPATTKLMIRQHIKIIDSKTADIETFTDSVKTLKSLEPYLEVRHDRLHGHL